MAAVRAEVSPKPALQPTPFLTPTPRQDGKIIYIVKVGDSLWRIAAIASITLEELMAMNGIQPGDYITEGMELELGVGGPALATAAPGDAQATPTQELLTPTPVVGTAEICILLFMDENGNGRLEEGELPLAGGQISIVDINGIVAGEVTTEELSEDDSVGHCRSGSSRVQPYDGFECACNSKTRRYQVSPIWCATELLNWRLAQYR